MKKACTQSVQKRLILLKNWYENLPDTQRSRFRKAIILIPIAVTIGIIILNASLVLTRNPTPPAEVVEVSTIKSTSTGMFGGWLWIALWTFLGVATLFVCAVIGLLIFKSGDSTTTHTTHTSTTHGNRNYKVIASIIVIILCVGLFSYLYATDSFKDARIGERIQTHIAEFRTEAKAEEAASALRKHEREAALRKELEIPVVAEPCVWSKPVIFKQGEVLDTRYPPDPDGPVWVAINGVVREDPYIPGKPYDLGPFFRELRFMPVRNEVVTFKITKRKLH